MPLISLAIKDSLGYLVNLNSNYKEKEKEFRSVLKIKRRVLSLLLPIFLLKQLRRCGIDQYQCNLLDTKLLECLRLILEPYLLISLTVGILQGE